MHNAPPAVGRRAVLRGALLAAGACLLELPASAARAATGMTVTAKSQDPAGAKTKYYDSFVLFQGGKKESLNGVAYHSFRIPALVKNNRTGTLLAFAEGRADSPSDYGNINLVYKRSTGHGAIGTWSSLLQVAGSGLGVWGNPTPVYDPADDAVYIFMNANAAGLAQFTTTDPVTGQSFTGITEYGQRRVAVMRSTDDGLTFTGLDGSATPTDLTDQITAYNSEPLLPAGYTFDMIGPGNGIATAAGDLVIPAYGRNLVRPAGSRVWHVQPLERATTEATITQLADGTLYRNDRPDTTHYATTAGRWVARGSVGAFGAFTGDVALTGTPCQGSCLQYNTDGSATNPTRTLFLNPQGVYRRDGMTVRISYDNAKTWLSGADRLIPTVAAKNQSGGGAVAGVQGGYSSMSLTGDANYKIGALIETDLLDVDANNEPVAVGSGDPDHSHRSIGFHRFDIAWILDL